MGSLCAATIPAFCLSECTQHSLDICSVPWSSQHQWDGNKLYFILYNGLSATMYITEYNSMISAVNSPDLDRPGAVPAHNPPAERRVYTEHSRDNVLMRLEQVLLIVRDQRHSLRWPIVVTARSRRALPCLDVSRGRATCRTYSAAKMSVIQEAYAH